jgi:hypothetical protein
MLTRLYVNEFFDALRKPQAYPLIDTPSVRGIVGRTTRSLSVDYPIKNRWPALDFESTYEGYLNAQPEPIEWHRTDYNGTVRPGAFDDTYDLNGWFDDVRMQWMLVDTPEFRRKMQSILPLTRAWRSPDLLGPRASISAQG